MKVTAKTLGSIRVQGPSVVSFTMLELQLTMWQCSQQRRLECEVTQKVTEKATFRSKVQVMVASWMW